MNYSMSYIDCWMLHVFVIMGTFYYLIRIIDTFRWWNGTDDNGDPK